MYIFNVRYAIFLFFSTLHYVGFPQMVLFKIQVFTGSVHTKHIFLPPWSQHVGFFVQAVIFSVASLLSAFGVYLQE